MSFSEVASYHQSVIVCLCLARILGEPLRMCGPRGKIGHTYWLFWPRLRSQVSGVKSYIILTVKSVLERGRKREREGERERERARERERERKREKQVAQGQYVVSYTRCAALHGCKSE